MEGLPVRLTLFCGVGGGGGFSSPQFSVAALGVPLVDLVANLASDTGFNDFWIARLIMREFPNALAPSVDVTITGYHDPGAEDASDDDDDDGGAAWMWTWTFQVNEPDAARGGASSPFFRVGAGFNLTTATSAATSSRYLSVLSSRRF